MKACNDKVQTYDDLRDDCEANQTAFENDYCTYAQAYETVCETQRTCRAQEEGKYNITKENVSVSEAARKQDYEVSMHMTCLLEVLSAKNHKLQARELETCKTLVVDTSEFDISYPDEQGNW